MKRLAHSGPSRAALRRTRRLLIGGLLAAGLVGTAAADAVDTLERFVRDVKGGSSAFTQVVTSPDGAKQKTSTGEFEFLRPNRFRFQYTKPFQQLIVSDGEKVWIHDPDLNQVSGRRLADAIGSTPAALLAGGSLARDFELKAQPDKDGLAWVEALPRVKDGPFQSLRVGFKGETLAAIEILDSFGQRSLLTFTGFTEAAVPPERFRFVPPAGADVIEQ